MARSHVSLCYANIGLDYWHIVADMNDVSTVKYIQDIQTSSKLKSSFWKNAKTCNETICGNSICGNVCLDTPTHKYIGDAHVNKCLASKSNIYLLSNMCDALIGKFGHNGSYTIKKQPFKQIKNELWRDTNDFVNVGEQKNVRVIDAPKPYNIVNFIDNFVDDFGIYMTKILLYDGAVLYVWIVDWDIEAYWFDTFILPNLSHLREIIVEENNSLLIIGNFGTYFDIAVANLNTPIPFLYKIYSDKKDKDGYIAFTNKLFFFRVDPVFEKLSNWSSHHIVKLLFDLNPHTNEIATKLKISTNDAINIFADKLIGDRNIFAESGVHELYANFCDTLIKTETNIRYVLQNTEATLRNKILKDSTPTKPQPKAKPKPKQKPKQKSYSYRRNDSSDDDRYEHSGWYGSQYNNRHNVRSERSDDDDNFGGGNSGNKNFGNVYNKNKHTYIALCNNC